MYASAERGPLQDDAFNRAHWVYSSGVARTISRFGEVADGNSEKGAGGGGVRFELTEGMTGCGSIRFRSVS